MGFVGEGEGVFCTHAADKAAFDDVIGFFAVYPCGVGIGFAPVFDFAHVGNVDDVDAFRLFGQLGVAEHLLDGGEPDGAVGFAVEVDLGFGAVVFGQVHAAIVPHGAVADLLRLRRRGVILFGTGTQEQGGEERR